MDKQSSHLYAFGTFRINVSERELSRDSVPVPLPPKVFDVLLVLVENHGRIVGKDELMRKVWADTFVEDANLTVNISALRKVLGEDSNGSQFIETIPKRGYRFVAPVLEVPNEEKKQIRKPPAQIREVASSSQTQPLRTGNVVALAEWHREEIEPVNEGSTHTDPAVDISPRFFNRRNVAIFIVPL